MHFGLNLNQKMLQNVRNVVASIIKSIYNSEKVTFLGPIAQLVRALR